jgi:perosamine synthetase
MANLSAIPLYVPEIGARELRYVQQAVRSGWVSSRGQFIARFERSFADYVGTRLGLATSSGTTALHLSLAALGIGPGDEVIAPDLTFVAPINAILYVGARPVLVDVEEFGWGLDPQAVEQRISDRTRAILAVHLYGNPCQIAEIARIAKRHNLLLIEDCAEACGAKFNSKLVGTFGDVSCFSFYGNKVITTGEGGMCLTNDVRVFERMRLLRDHGMTQARRYWHSVVGFNYRMTNLQAALGLAQLEKIESILSRKRRIATAYAHALAEELEVQTSPPRGESVFWLFSVLARSHSWQSKLMRALEGERIETRRFFYPVHRMPPYRSFGRASELRVSTDLSARGLNLPSYPSLSHREIERVSAVLLDALTL